VTIADPRVDRLFYGAPALHTRWAGWTLKGSLVRSRRRFLAKAPASALAAVRAALSPEALHYLEGDVLVSARMACEPLIELDEQVVRHAMGGDPKGMLAFAREIATYDLDGGLYRGMLRIIGGALSLRVYATAYETYFHPGRIVVLESDARGATLGLEGVVLPRYMCTYGFAGYIERLLEIARSPRPVRHECRHEGAGRCAWRIDAAS
jgi:hypothetical protein